MVERESMLPRREFHIAPKATRDWLASQKNFLLSNIRIRIASDIVVNARELAPGADWDNILHHHLYAAWGNAKHRGENAVSDLIAPTIGSVAAYMGWDMHSPEVVYMSGCFFLNQLRSESERITKRLEDGRKGNRLFVSPEAQEAAFAREQKAVEQLTTDRQLLETSLSEYVSQNLPPNSKYLEILGNLLSYGSSKIPTCKRNGVLGFLKGGEIDKAHEAMMITRTRTAPANSS